MWRLGGLSWREFLLRTTKAYRSNQLDARSAQFAYYSLLALAPLMIVVIAAVAQLPLKGVLNSFLSAINVGMPQNVVALIDHQIADIQARSSLGLIAAGLLLLGIAGSRVFLSLGAGLDSAYSVLQPARFVKSLGIAVALTFSVFLLLLVAMVLLVIGPMLADVVVSRIEVAWVAVLLSSGVRWGVAGGFMLIASTIIYQQAPGVRQPWYWITPGSVFATLAWVTLTQGLRIYVENFARYNETYGALGGVVVLMIWLYLTGSVLLLGAQVNGVIHQAACE